MFTRVPKTIDNLLSDVITKDAITIKERKKFIEQQFMDINNKIALNANKVIQKQLSDTDRNRVNYNFQQGNIVWFYNPVVKCGHVKKLTPSWQKSFKIHKILGPVTVILMNEARKTLREPVHVSYLKFYKLPQCPVEQHQIDPSADNLGPELQFDKNSQNFPWREPLQHMAPNKNQEVENKQQDGENYEVEAILNHQMWKHRLQFRVYWKGFAPTDDSWIDVSNMNTC
jgi:hypothetical protein